MNEVILSGKVYHFSFRPSQPDQTGKTKPAYAKFVVRSNRPNYKELHEKNMQESDYLNCEAFGLMAENIAKYYGTGEKQIMLRGRLISRSYTDQNTGQNKNWTGISVEKYEPVYTLCSVEQARELVSKDAERQAKKTQTSFSQVANNQIPQNYQNNQARGYNQGQFVNNMSQPVYSAPNQMQNTVNGYTNPNVVQTSPGMNSHPMQSNQPVQMTGGYVKPVNSGQSANTANNVVNNGNTVTATPVNQNTGPVVPDAFSTPVGMNFNAGQMQGAFGQPNEQLVISDDDLPF